MLDEIVQKAHLETFLSVFHQASRGKLLERYTFLNQEGIKILNSEKIHRKNCYKNEHLNGRVTYHNQILEAARSHPDLSQTLPLCLESITKQNRTVKNDFEGNAFYRFLVDL